VPTQCPQACACRWPLVCWWRRLLGCSILLLALGPCSLLLRHGKVCADSAQRSRARAVAQLKSQRKGESRTIKTGRSLYLYIYIRGVLYSLFNWSFLVVYWTFVLAILSSIVVSFYNKTPLQRRSHSRVFTPTSPARGGGGALFCYPWGTGPDLAAGRGVVPRLSVPILGLPSGVARGPAGPTDRGWGPLSRPDRATEGGCDAMCIIAAGHWYSIPARSESAHGADRALIFGTVNVMCRCREAKLRVRLGSRFPTVGRCRPCTRSS
jgi:hypothetical protein